MKALERAFASLQGLWVGDAFGGHFEFEHVDWQRPKRAATKRELPPAVWRYTDDTQMALSIYEILRRFEVIVPEKLAESFAKNFDISRGYGLGAERLLLDFQAGGDWSILAASMFDGSGSYGNGSAMRAAPIGAYFADDIEKAVENARQSSIVTHMHPDGIAGAIAVAVGAAYAYQFSILDENPSPKVFLETVAKFVPKGKLNKGIQLAASLDESTTTEQAAKILGSGWDISAKDTVPFALWCAARYLDDFEEALWQTIGVGGDTDTTGAIVGGIVASYGGANCIPRVWRERCEPLPKWSFSENDKG